MYKTKLSRVEARLDEFDETLSGFDLIEGKRKLAEMEAEIAAAELAVAQAELKLKRARLTAQIAAEEESSSATAAPSAVTKKTPAKKSPAKKPSAKKSPAKKSSALAKKKFVRANPPKVGDFVYVPQKNKSPNPGIVLKLTKTQAYVGLYNDRVVKRFFWRNLKNLGFDPFQGEDDDGLDNGQIYKMFYTGRYLDSDGVRKNGPAVVTARFVGETSGVLKMRLVVKNRAAGGVITPGAVVDVPRNYIISLASI